MNTGSGLALWRRLMLWVIPGGLLAALAWSLIPPGILPATPGRLASGGGASTPTATAPPESPPASRPGKTVASGEIQAGTLVGTDEAGHRQWEISAEDMVLAEGRTVVLLRGVRATFYDPKGTPMTISGDRGRYDTNTREVDLEGSVHGVSSIGRELFADAVHYSPASATVTGTGHVRVIQERVIMYADQLVSDITLGQTRFSGHIHMTLR